jgi:hypothetical protein
MITHLLAQAVALDKRAPVATWATGLVSGVWGWMLMQLHALAGLVTDIGLIAAGVTSILVLVVKIASIWESWKTRHSIVPRDEDEP